MPDSYNPLPVAPPPPPPQATNYGTSYVPGMAPAQVPTGPAGYGAAPQLGGSTYSGGGQSTDGGPSIFGTGMYQGAPIGINQNAFNNPVGVQAGQALSGQISNQLGATTQDVNAAQAAGGNPADYQSGLAGEQALAARYGQMANGQGPSLATVAAQQQGASNLASAESLLGSARGAGNPAQAQMAARNAQATGGQQIAQNVVQGRTAEELGALGAQGGLYGNIAGQGLQEQGLGNQLGEFNAGQANQVGMGNQANRLAANQSYSGLLSGINGQQQQGQIAGQQLAAQTQLGQQQLQEQAYEAAAAANAKLAGSVMQAAGGVASMFL